MGEIVCQDSSLWPTDQDCKRSFFLLSIRRGLWLTIEAKSSLELNLNKKWPFSVKEMREGLDGIQEASTHCSNLSRDDLLPTNIPIADNVKDSLLLETMC